MAVDTGWTCTNCGSDGGHPIENKLGSFTQFDPRYTTGYCDVCTTANPDKPRKTARPTNQMIQSEHFNREKFTEKKERDKLTQLVKAFSAGGSHVQMSDPDIYQLATLAEKYGSPGFAVQPATRAAAEKYANTTVLQQTINRRRKNEKKRR